jgi:2-dehydro-3-deoxyphosphogluconate aldolase/(4S)-4-hydroxy-2-oxoglutarate aldolase
MRAVDHGAQFLVAPNTDGDMLEWARQAHVPFIPGALTPSEILAAVSRGVRVIKLFPATSMGPGYIEQLRAPLREPRFLAVGGITAKNAQSFIRAGANFVGVGSWLVGDGSVDGVRDRAASLRHAIAAIGTTEERAS